jgi:hypothetical protein
MCELFSHLFKQKNLSFVYYHMESVYFNNTEKLWFKGLSYKGPYISIVPK